MAIKKIQDLTAVAVGQVTHDRYGDAVVPGGCAFFGAKTFAGLCAKSKLLTSVGLDFQCEADLANIEVVKKTEGKTTVFSNIYPPDKPRLQLVEAQASPIESSMFPSEWFDADLLFVAPVMGEMAPVPWSKIAKAKYTTVGLQGFMKRASGHRQNGKAVVVPLEQALSFELLHGVDAVFLSEEDIELFGTADLLSRLRATVPIVAVTLGENGSVVYEGEKEIRIGVYKTDAKDPTGAGDTFAAATSLALASGMPALEAAKLGSAAASIVVEADGGKNLGRLAEAFERVSRIL